MRRIFIIYALLISVSAFSQSYITKDIDKFSGKVTYRTPILKPICFEKITTTTDTLYVMALRSCGATYNQAQGVIILFDDKTKIEKHEQKVDVDVSSKEGCDYDVHSFIVLNAQDMDALKIKKIIAFRQYIYDTDVADGDIYLKYFNSLLATK